MAITIEETVSTTQLGLLQKMKIKLFGKAKVGIVKEDGWSSDMHLYAFNCRHHGIVYAVPTGFSYNLVCPICLEEVSNDYAELSDLLTITDVEMIESQQH